ncbi:zinc finger protein 626 [Drosophila teissieri]|uniref:zinc finger protein 626 n=1 Tax=Drosophila teissieri TaxID=7243 RepID=UPI001CBA4CE7|nr:zinc finger protein 626 [Drosophila teissieri]
MSWPGKLLVTYENFTADLPVLSIDKQPDGCPASCSCKCKCCRGFREKYVAFNGEGETIFGPDFSNQLCEDVQKIMRFRSSDVLVLLRTAQLRDNFWTNEYFKADLQKDFRAIFNAFEDENRNVQLEKLAAILDTVSTGYRRAVSQLAGPEAQGALRPKIAASFRPGLRCDCNKCENLPWKKLQDVEDHQSTHRYSDNFHCQICYRRFYLQHSLTSHIIRKSTSSQELHENRRYKRLLENQKSQEQKELELSPGKVEDILVPVAKDLQSYFKEESKLSIEKRKISTLSKCPTCDQNYGFSFSHQLHMVKHRRAKLDTNFPFHCSFCNRSFLTRKFLLKHQKRVRTVSTLLYRPFKCTHCTWRFQLKSALDAHVLRIHERRKPCLICKLPTSRLCCPAHTTRECNKALQKYRDKMRPLRGPPKGGCRKQATPVCEICNRKFTRKFFLNEHMNKAHLNKRNFTCEICGANFYSQGTMQTHRKAVHLLTHTIKCEVCDLTIKSKGNYLRHCKSQSHRDNLLKFGKSDDKTRVTNGNQRFSTTLRATEEKLDLKASSSTNRDKTFENGSTHMVKNVDKQIKQTQSKTSGTLKKRLKLKFCKTCGISIVGSMQRHYKSMKHKLNLKAQQK